MAAKILSAIAPIPVLSLRRAGLLSATLLSALDGVYVLLVLLSLATTTSDLQLMSGLAIVVAVPAFLCLLVSVAMCAPSGRTFPAQLALVCGALYGVLATFTYLTQATVVRLVLPTARYESFAVLDLQNQDSITAVTDMAGYLFLGLSLLALGLTFAGDATRAARRLFRVCLAGGSLCLIAVLAFVLTMETVRYLALAALCPVLLGIAIAFVFYFLRRPAPAA